MKKINVKATIFLSAIVLVVVVLLLNLIEFRKTVDFTVPGIRMPKENAYGKQEEVQVSVNGTYYYRVLPWIHGSTFHGQISFVGEGEEPQNYFFTYGASRGFLKEGRGAGWIGTPDAQTTVAIYEAVQNVGKGMISVEDPASYVLYPATTPEEAIAIANVLYPGMLENEAKTASCAAFLPEECPQKIGCSFCTEDYDYVEDAAAVEQLWQEFIQLSGKVTSDPILLLRPLNAVSSVLLKRHSLFLTSEVHLPVLLHTLRLCQRKALLTVLFSDSYMIYPIFSFDLSYVVSTHQDRLLESG